MWGKQKALEMMEKAGFQNVDVKQIEEDTFNMDPSKIEEAISPKTKCILPVHLYGQCSNMEEIIRPEFSWGNRPL